jgi:cell wall-associated NlpC family hydrolase
VVTPLRLIAVAAALAAALACTASAGTGSWAAPQIRVVTGAGVLGTSPATFAPQSPLTQAALAAAIRAADAKLAPAAPPPPKPAPLTLASTIGPGATIAGVATLELDVTGRDVDHVDFAVDGTGAQTAFDEPYTLALDTRTLPDGPHTLAVNVALAGGGYAIATWPITVANAPGSVLTPTGAPVALAIAKQWLPAPKNDATTAPAVQHVFYRAASPAQPVTVKQLDAALVAYLGLGDAARKIQQTLVEAGLQPPGNTGTEAVARMLGLRLNHPASDDSLELLPNEPVTRAEAAYSFAQLFQLGGWSTQSVQQAADTFTLPTFSPWQRRLLTTAVHYVGYPYIWGGTSASAETLFGVRSAGGFDCSGFVWRVYKLTAYAGEGRLASVLRGRTTYQMSGEVPHSQLLPAAKLQPADVMFFGAHGPRSKPSEVDHTALYLGNGWFIQSSGEGVTLLPFGGWYTHSYAWGRRPLREAGLG